MWCGGILIKNELRVALYEILGFFLGNMSGKLPPLSPHISKSWTGWIDTIEDTDLFCKYNIICISSIIQAFLTVKGSQRKENKGNSTKLPRSDILLYGIYPKMEPRVYVVCNDCSKVIRPYNVASHTKQCKDDKKAAENQLETPSSSNAVKKKSSQTKSKKKSILPANVPPPPLFPVSTLSCCVVLCCVVLCVWV